MLSVPLPFYLALPDRRFFRVPINGAANWVECEQINGSTLVSMTENALEWLGKSKEDNVNVIYVWTKNSADEVVKHQEIYSSSASSDVIGLVYPKKLSRLRIYTELDVISSLDNENVLNDFKQNVHRVASRFVDLYCFAMSDISVARFFSQEPYCSVLWWTDHYSINGGALMLEDGVAFNYLKHLDPIQLSEPNYLFKKPRGDVDKFSSELAREAKIPDYLEILLEARVLIARRQYDLSIVLSETAFEVFLRATLVRVCERAGILALPDRNGAAKRPYHEAIEKGDLIRDLIRLLNLFSVVNIKSTDLYEKWRTRTYGKRICVVHKAVFGSTQEDALLAHNSAANYIQYLSQLKYQVPDMNNS